MFVSKTYELQDTIYYHESEQSYTASSSSEAQPLLHNDFQTSLPTDWELSYDVNLVSSMAFAMGKNNGKPMHSIFTQKSSSTVYLTYRGATSSSNVNVWQQNISGYISVKIVCENSEVKFYVNDNLVSTNTIDWITSFTDYTFFWWSWATGTSYVKNLKLRTL